MRPARVATPAYAGVFVADGEDAEAEGGHDDAENAEPAQVTLFLFHEGVLASVRIEVLEDFLARVHAALAVDALDVAVRGGGVMNSSSATFFCV